MRQGPLSGEAAIETVIARELVCIRPKYADCRWTRELESSGWVVNTACDFNAAHRLLNERACRVGVLVPGMINESACAELDLFLRTHRMAEWVGVLEPALLDTAYGRDLVVEHLFDHHTAPVDAARIAPTLGHAWGRATMRQAPEPAVPRGRDPLILGHSPLTLELLRQIRRVAKVDAPVMIYGESGSGKELTAQAIHRHSSRADGPFVPVNCGAIQASLIQSQLFGHVKGAFTGATGDGRGFIEAASGGTIFLDEIGDLSLDLQINLLRFLQEKTINRVGSTRSIRVDARVIAATHVNLDKAVAAGTFREDLFYRLNVVPLTVPSLRQRPDDVTLLAEHFFDQFAKERGPQVKGFSRRAMGALSAHNWPGNVRELINRVRRAVVMAEGQFISPQDLGLEEPDESHEWIALDQARMRAEHSAISVSLQQAGKNVSAAARTLGVSRMTLYRLMAKHGFTEGSEPIA